MANSFDPYVEWLNIPKQGAHPDRYRLLNLPPFESDPNVIEQAAGLQIRHVSQFASGPQADIARRLLEELQNAKACLLDANKKTIYDAALRQQMAARGMNVSGAPAPAAKVSATPAATVAAPIAPTTVAATTNDIDSWLPPVADADALLPQPVQPAAMPVAAQPLTAQPYAAQPYAAQPVMAQPLAAQPHAGYPPQAVPVSAMPLAVAAVPQAVPVSVAPMYPQAASVGGYGAAPVAQAVPVYGGAPMAQAAPAYAAPAYAAPAYPQTAATSLLDDAPSPSMSPESADPFAASVPAATSRIAKRRNQSHAAPVFVGVVVMLAVAVGAGWYLVKAGYIKLEEPGAQPVAAVGTETDEPATRTSKPTIRPTASIRPGDVEVSPMQPSDEPATSPTDEPADDMPDESMDKPEAPDKPEMTEPEESPEDKPEMKPEPEPASELDDPEPAKPVRKPGLRPGVPQTLAKAREAMASKDMLAATRFVNQAEENASEEEKAQVERAKLILTYVEQFWKAFDEALAAIPEGEDFPYKDDRISIVEKNPKFLILRMGGKNTTYSMDLLPSKLAMMFADRFFNDSPANDLPRGAFLLVHPRGDKDKARELWAAASRQGLNAEVEAILPELDLELPATEEEPAMEAKVPPGAEITAAREEVRQLFQDDFAMAKTPPEWIVLADKLLTQALESQENTQRYALLVEARDAAALSGDTGTLTRVADSLAGIYKANAEEEKTRGLDAAVKAADKDEAGPEVFAVVAQAALDLTDEAVLAEDYKTALARVQVAVAAANKNGDKDLKKQAISQQKGVKAQMKKK